ADWGVGPQALEKAAGGRFGTVAQLAGALQAAGLGPRPTQAAQPGPAPPSPRSGGAWLAAAASRPPAAIPPAGALHAPLGKPADWLEAHAGIRGRRAWGDEDAVQAAAQAGRDCLVAAGVGVDQVGALLVTGEAPPQLVGLGATLHARLGLGAS